MGYFMKIFVKLGMILNLIFVKVVIVERIKARIDLFICKFDL